MKKKPSYTASEKGEILKCYLQDKEPVSQICQKYNISEKDLKYWEKKLFENSGQALKNIPKDGTNYFQNYDLVINYLSDAFKGHTLDVLGVKTAPIKRVSSFKIADISVQAGIIDLLFEDIDGNFYHIEEQRNIKEEDFYRFGGQHFFVAKDCKDNIIDIILISGRHKYTGKREIKTLCATYSPKIIDFTKKDGPERFEKIKQAVDKGDYSNLIELIFIPLYGTENEFKQKEFAEKVVFYELDLCKKVKFLNTSWQQA